MGNTVLSECRTGTSDQSGNNHLPTISDLTCINVLNKKFIKNPQQLTSKIQQNNQQQKSTKLSSLSSILSIPQRSPQIQKIYQSLIKQKPMQYSIQRKQYLTYFNVHSLKQLKEKLIHSKSAKKDVQINKISLSSPQSRKMNIDHNIGQLKLMTYKLQPENINDSSIDKIAYRERSFSKSFDLNDEDIEDNCNYQQKSKNTPSFYNQKQFQITNKNYIYLGHVNAQNIPHGPGQLYSYSQINQTQNDFPIFIQAEFVNGSIFSNDIVIINQNGGYYRGGYAGDSFHGKGKLYQNDGLTLQGNFINGLLQGKSKATYPDLGIYEGYFHQGLREGKGIMIWKSKQISFQANSPLTITYDGYFKADQMQGLGYLKTPNYEYWGPFVSNMKQGKGTLKFNDGKKYQGWFQKDQISGYGQLHYPDGYVQKGIFPLTKKQ